MNLFFGGYIKMNSPSRSKVFRSGVLERLSTRLPSATHSKGEYIAAIKSHYVDEESLKIFCKQNGFSYKLDNGYYRLSR